MWEAMWKRKAARGVVRLHGRGGEVMRFAVQCWFTRSYNESITIISTRFKNVPTS